MGSHRAALSGRIGSAAARDRPVGSRWRQHRVWRAAIWTLSIVPFAVVLWIAATMLLARGEILPGVQIGTTPAGGLDPAEAVAAVETDTASLGRQPVTLTIDGASWTAVPAELGFTVDAPASVAAAMAYGREQAVGDGLLRAVRLADDPVVVPLVVRFDPGPFHAWLDRVDAEHADRPVDARVVIAGTEVTVVPGQRGTVIDREALRTTLIDRIPELAPLAVTVATTEGAPVIRTGEAERARAIAAAAIAEPLTFTVDDDTYPLAPEEMAALIDVTPDPTDPTALAVGLDPAGVDALVAELAGEIDQEAADAWVQDLGTHSWLVPGQRERSVDRDALATRVHAAFATGPGTVAVPVVDGAQPEVSTTELMEALGMTARLATGDSIYAGSGAGRAHNVELATSMIDGTLVPPGGVFSFNDAVGSLFNGRYRDAGSYLDGPNGRAIAGGVCQVSTTVFRAALAAGFPIVEWWPHSYRSPYYELGGWSPGYDAAIVQDLNTPQLSTDFRFRNPTDTWLMIRSTVTADDELRVEIHGAPTGYEVAFADPVVDVMAWAPDAVTVSVDPELPPGTVLPDQPAMDGLKVTVTRTVSDADGAQVSVDHFVSTYGAYGAIRRISPDMDGTAAAQA